MKAVGDRVRLHSGEDVGVVVKYVSSTEVHVKWQAGPTSAWYDNDLVLLADEAVVCGHQIPISEYCEQCNRLGLV